MPELGHCRICEYWKKYPYKVSEKELFNKKCREGTSLRKLELLLEAFGLKARKDLIRKHISVCMDIQVSQQRAEEKGKHISVCMDIQVSQQRAEEKGIKRGDLKSIGRKLNNFFIRPKEEPQIPKACSHEVTEPFFDLSSERVHVRCRQCGKVLSGSVDPHTKKKRDRRDLIVCGSLRKRKE